MLCIVLLWIPALGGSSTTTSGFSINLISLFVVKKSTRSPLKNWIFLMSRKMMVDAPFLIKRMLKNSSKN